MRQEHSLITFSFQENNVSLSFHFSSGEIARKDKDNISTNIFLECSFFPWQQEVQATVFHVGWWFCQSSQDKKEATFSKTMQHPSDKRLKRRQGTPKFINYFE